MFDTELVSNFIAVTVGIAIVGLLQMRRAKGASMRIEQAADHFEAANQAHEEWLAKVRAHAVEVLGRLQQATYVAETNAGLAEDRRIARELPQELAAQPVARPRTPAAKARAARTRRRNRG